MRRKRSSAAGWIAVFVFFACTSAQAESMVIDQQDEFTDERELYVGITADDYSSFDPSALVFTCNEGDIAFAINAGLLFHLESRIAVKLRFDSKPARDQRFIWNETTAVKTGGARELLDEAIASDRLIAKVGDSDTLRFDLKSARENLMKFDQLCQQWEEMAGS